MKEKTKGQLSKGKREKVTSRQVEVAGRTITYIHSVKNVKNINLRINVDGSVHISTPPKTSQNYVDKFVERKADFIFEALDKFEKIRENSTEKIEDNHLIKEGKTLYVQGLAYKVKLIYSPFKELRINDINREIIIFSTYPQNHPKNQEIVYKWIKEHALLVFTSLCEKIYPQLSEYQILWPEIKIRKMKSRWGSCNYNKKILTFALMLIHLPTDCIEYVVAHELAHLVVPNHSKDFYKLLEELMPDYKERRQRLRDFKI